MAPFLQKGAKAGGTPAVVDLSPPQDPSLPYAAADLSDSAAAAAAVEQLVELVGLVHVGEQLALHVLPRPRDEVQHDGLGNHINHCAADNVEVRCDEQFW